MPCTPEQIERDLRRASIVIRLAEQRPVDIARVLYERERQDRWLEEWVTARAVVTK